MSRSVCFHGIIKFVGLLVTLGAVITPGGCGPDTTSENAASESPDQLVAQLWEYSQETDLIGVDQTTEKLIAQGKRALPTLRAEKARANAMRHSNVEELQILSMYRVALDEAIAAIEEKDPPSYGS